MLSRLDILVIVGFISGLLIYGVMSGKKNTSSEDYFLGGRNLPWGVAMLSIVATETSVLTFISIPGIAYRGDWTFLQLAIGYILGRGLVSWILLPIYFKEGVSSIYEIIGKHFGKDVQKTASGVFLITRILADGVRYLATGVIVQALTGWPLWVAILLIGLVTLVYSLYGGIRTIIWIDALQFGLYLSGGLIVIGFAYYLADATQLEQISSAFGSEKTMIFNWDWNLFSNPYAFLSAVLGGILLSFSSHGVDYMMVQRVLSTKNLSSARKAMVGSGFFVFFQFAIFLLAGTMLYGFYGGVEIVKDREFSKFIIEYLPAGLRGILLAGVLSAAMSTLSSSINSLASSTVIDWMGGKASMKVSRLVSLGWATLLITIALLFVEGDSAIVIVGLQIASFTYGGLLGLFLLTKFNKKFSYISILSGLLTSVGIVFYLKTIGLAWTWFIAVSVLVNIVTVLVVDAIISKNKR